LIPPAIVRRPISITLWLALALLFLTLSPLLFLLAALADALDRKRRSTLVTRVLLSYFLREVTTLAGCGVIWLLAGVGTQLSSKSISRLHWRLLRWFVSGLAETVLRTLSIEITDAPDSAEADRALDRDGPIIVLSRHAGPADTLLIIHRLLSGFDRRPSVVFKEAITLDPSVDLIAHRLPHAVLDVSDSRECEARIKRTAASLGRRGVLLIFPEGGNFTPGASSTGTPLPAPSRSW
jgi:hypothetical protein